MTNESWEFWHRVDELRKGETLKDVCARAGLNYSSVLNRKAGANPSMPRLETAYVLATALHTTVEYLLTGKDPPPRYSRIQDIIDWLMAKSDAELDGFRQYNHVPREKEQSSFSRQEA